MARQRASLFTAAILFGLSTIGHCHRAQADEPLLTSGDLTVLDAPVRNMMQDYLTAIVDEQFAQRSATLAKLHTAADWQRRADFIRQSMIEWTGPFPEKGPLNARVTGRLNRPDYILEKVLFESRPGFLVSANLYLPKGEAARRPTVLNVIGHSAAGKATDKVQQRSIAQVRKGFVVLTIDGIGQGERKITDYAPYGGPPSNAHQLLGRQAFLAGTHLFNLMAWDVIRAVDYLVSRPEVDPQRIACTGCSGGGMMTTYLLPLEPRIHVAVPACNPCTWSHRVHAGLATDHEQVFFGAFAAGIDPRGDPLFCQVPKPLLINATTDDNLNPPSGVWELSTWLDKAYAAHGVPERVKTSMVRAPHGYTLGQREVAYAWMLKWLGGNVADFHEGEIAIESEADTWCTPGGNVYVDKHSWQPQALVLDYMRQHRPHWPTIRTREELAAHQKRLRKLLPEALSLPHKISKCTAKHGEARVAGQLKLTPIVLTPEVGITLPGVWIEPHGTAVGQRIIVYLNDRGKSQLAQQHIVEQLVLDDGYRILAIDLRGTGETAPGLENKLWDFLAGRTLFAQRVADVRSVLHWLSTVHSDSDMHVWATGLSGTQAAMAAAIEGHVTGLVLEEPLLSFESIVQVRIPTYRNEVLVPEILEHFDMQEVYQSLLPNSVTLLNPLRGDGVPASDTEANQTYQQIMDMSASPEMTRRWRVLTNVKEQDQAESVRSAFTSP